MFKKSKFKLGENIEIIPQYRNVVIRNNPYFKLLLSEAHYQGIVAGYNNHTKVILMKLKNKYISYRIDAKYIKSIDLTKKVNNILKL